MSCMRRFSPRDKFIFYFPPRRSYVWNLRISYFAIYVKYKSAADVVTCTFTSAYKMLSKYNWEKAIRNMSIFFFKLWSINKAICFCHEYRKIKTSFRCWHCAAPTLFLGYCSGRSTERWGKTYTFWLQPSYLTALYQRWLWSWESRICGEFLLGWSHAHRILFPRHGWPRRSNWYCCENQWNW